MKTIFERDGAFKITVAQRKNGVFVLTYGKEQTVGEYVTIAHKLGEVMFHCLSCEGVIDTDNVRME